ncbi:MAG TPA: PAS domain-containing protein, partial [Methanomethylovorans sp.]|nr:PAS domain-containing protein [Methanomethylovorans sp.]
MSEGSQVAVVFWGGVEYWPVICVSGNFEQWGYSEEDIASGKIRYEQILHPEDLQKVRSFILQRIAEGYNDAVQQYRILDASGNIHWVEEISLFHTEDNDNLSCQAILRDITTEQENLFRRIRLEKLIANIATNFANLPDNRIDEGINKALKLIGEFAGANRSCLFESS